MFFNKKIPCYVLVFDQVEIVRKTLEFLTKQADRLDIVVLENPSPHTVQIKKLINDYGKKGFIKRYYLLDENITGNAFTVVLNNELRFIKKSPWVVITDGDMTCSDSSWLDEQINILKRHSDVFTCGVTLDDSNLPIDAFPEAKNWVPPDKKEFEDFYEVFTGAHLLLFRGRELYEFMRWRNKHDLNFVDGELHRFCEEQLHKKWGRTKKSKAYHLTWDLYSDKKHPYTRMKTTKDFKATWYHNKDSTYSVVNY